MGTRNMLVGFAIGMTIVFVFQIGSDRQQTERFEFGDHRVQSLEVKPLIAAARPHTSAVALTASKPKPLSVTLPVADPPAPSQVSASVTEVGSRTLRQVLEDSTREAKVLQPSDTELVAFERLFSETMRSAALRPSLSRQWGELGWRVDVCEQSSETKQSVLVISEMGDRRFGRGVYAIRIGSTAKVILQAPHRFYDIHTGLIARKLFQEHPVRAVAWNSVHRQQLDLAHCHQHYINAFTRAVVSVDASALVAQIHGFSNDKQIARAANADVIVSDGTRFPARAQWMVAADLKQVFGEKSVLLFPTEIDVLGGTTNRQVRVMRNAGANGFLHLEMNAKFRQELTTDASKRASFFRSLTGE